MRTLYPMMAEFAEWDYTEDANPTIKISDIVKVRLPIPCPEIGIYGEQIKKDRERALIPKKHRLFFGDLKGRNQYFYHDHEMILNFMDKQKRKDDK